MILCIMRTEGISSLANSLTNDTGMDETKMDICVFLASLFGLKYFATLKAGELATFGLTYHGLHNRIQI